MWFGREIRFRDRAEAGASLAGALSAYRGTGVLVLGIPRGGVSVAAEVARGLDADLDVIVARKVGSPWSPELALGAVTANGARFLNEEIIRELGVSPAYLKSAVAEEIAEARRREERFRGPNHGHSIEGRTVIVVDDGLATGATMRAAVRSVRQRNPARLIAAVPVGARETCDALRPEVDELVCLGMPEPFYAVGLYYDHFEPVPDDEVQRLLRDAYAAHRPTGGP